VIETFMIEHELRRQAERMAWLGRPYEHRELLNDLFRLYLLLGPVQLDLDADLELQALRVRWHSEPETLDVVNARPGSLVRSLWEVQVSVDEPLDDFGAATLVTILHRHSERLGWRNFPSLPLSDDAHVALKQALVDFVTRYGLTRAANNPIRRGDVDIRVYPTPFGVTQYAITIGDTTIPGVVRGSELEALEAAKQAVRLHSTALGELL
jgi:hypothetical protein